MSRLDLDKFPATHSQQQKINWPRLQPWSEDRIFSNPGTIRRRCRAYPGCLLWFLGFRLAAACACFAGVATRAIFAWVVWYCHVSFVLGLLSRSSDNDGPRSEFRTLSVQTVYKHDAHVNTGGPNPTDSCVCLENISPGLRSVGNWIDLWWAFNDISYLGNFLVDNPWSGDGSEISGWLLREVWGASGDPPENSPGTIQEHS